VITRRRFHLLRLIFWAAQIPLALATGLKSSVEYIVALSIAALVESAGTDYDQARQDEKKRRG
jgi:ABC-type glucose/galactose transport system permease subunit